MKAPVPLAVIVAAGCVVAAAAALLFVPASPVALPFMRASASLDRNVFTPHREEIADEARRREFVLGQQMFTMHWTEHVPPKDVAFDGLGPTFNQTSCIGCHVHGGRGRPPGEGEAMETMVVRLSLPGGGPHPAYGDQLNERAVPGVLPEGRAQITTVEVPGTYGDGTAYVLARPEVRFADLAYGPLDAHPVSARVAQATVGLGLLEAVPDAALAAMADPDDADGDGISGRVSRVTLHDGTPAAGRFGWKAAMPTLAEQAAEAGLNDMGLTSYLRPSANCQPAQAACVARAVRPRPDMSDNFFDNLVTYLQMTTVPERRNEDDPTVKHGEALFAAFGCANCHRPTLDTGEAAALPELANLTFRPYTDLLLHDMGEGLADGQTVGDASGREWRTAPLWGIGLTETVSGHSYLLHDGRARSLLEAILWHGGEAEAARERVVAATPEERKALIRFLESL